MFKNRKSRWECGLGWDGECAFASCLSRSKTTNTFARRKTVTIPPKVPAPPVLVTATKPRSAEQARRVRLHNMTSVAPCEMSAIKRGPAPNRTDTWDLLFFAEDGGVWQTLHQPKMGMTMRDPSHPILDCATTFRKCRVRSSTIMDFRWQGVMHASTCSLGASLMTSAVL